MALLDSALLICNCSHGGRSVAGGNLDLIASRMPSLQRAGVLSVMSLNGSCANQKCSSFRHQGVNSERQALASMQRFGVDRIQVHE